VTDDAHHEPTTHGRAAAPSSASASSVPGPAGSPAPSSSAAPAPERPGAPSAAAPGSPARLPEYKGDELDAERGPGLGCFWFQVVLLVFFFILTPLTVELQWPPLVSAILLFVTLGLLLFVGQTVIFLLRIVAAERRGRRRPLASSTRTVGEIEETADPAPSVDAGVATASGPAIAADTTDERPDGAGGVRQ
jgi:hypothetical protein